MLSLRLSRCVTATSFAALIAATPQLVSAQGQLDEIVVTAQKRAESAQDIPLTISAFGEDRLENSGFDSFDDLATLTPSLQFGNFGPITFVNIRGIGNENTTAGGDPGVALHFDGVYLGRPVGALFTAFDSERVEILKGPQGTLYGRNATGGSINYITKKPTDEFEGEFDVTYGNYNWIRTRGAVNIPINDMIRTRVVGFFEDRDGFTQNLVPGGTESNDADNWGVRTHIDFDLGAKGSLLVSGTYLESGGVGSKGELREPYPGTTTDPITNIGGPPGFAFSPGGPASGIPAGNNYLDADGQPVVNDLSPFSEARDLRESQDNDFLLLSATLEYDFGPVLFKSISGYGETSFESSQDGDHSALDLSELLLTEDAEQFSQELQLVSNTDSPFQWIVGAYYFNEEAERRSQFFRSRFDVFAANAGVLSGFDVGGEVETTSWAVFGQGVYAITDTLNFTGGVRYSNDEKEGVNSGFQFTGAPYADPVRGQFDDVTYRIALDWAVADDVLLFGSFSTGYKSGGINQVAAPSLGATNAIFDPETVEAIELGVKSTIADGRLRVNASLFNNNYDDQQFQVFGPGGPEAFNAEGSTVRGVEVELLGYVNETIGFDAAIGYTDSEFDDQIINGVQIGGNQVQRTPEWTFAAGVTGDWNFGGLGALRTRLEYSYTDEIFYTALNRSAGFDEPGGSDLADSYSNVNLRVFWFSEDSKWTAEFAATNVFDTEQEGNILRGIGFLDIPGGGGPEEVTYNPPRQISGRIGYAF